MAGRIGAFMKKIFALVICLVLLVVIILNARCYPYDDEYEMVTDYSLADTVPEILIVDKFFDGEYPYALDDAVMTVDPPVVSFENQVAAFAKAALEEFHQNEMYEDYYLAYLYHDKTDDIWYAVFYSMTSYSGVVAGGTVEVVFAIDANSWQLLNVWHFGGE